VTLSERNAYEVHAELLRRVANLETAVLLLARHVDAAGWSDELQHVLGQLLEAGRGSPPPSVGIVLVEPGRRQFVVRDRSGAYRVTVERVSVRAAEYTLMNGAAH
jgi:hypothetical protein